MQKDAITLYLESLNLDSRIDLCFKAHNLLLQIGSNNHLDVYAVIESYAEEYESDTYFERIENLLKDHMLEEISEFGILMSTSRLDIMIEILESLYTLEKRDDCEILKSLVSSDTDPIDVLCDLLSHIYGRHEIEYMEVIDVVSPDLITKIVAVLDHMEESNIQEDYDKMEVDCEEYHSQEKRISKIRKLYIYLKTKVDSPIFSKLLEDGVRLGFGLDTYLMQLDEADVDYTVSSFTNEYLAVYVASGEPLDDLHEKLSDRLETMFDSVKEIADTLQRTAFIINDLKVFDYGND